MKMQQEKQRKEEEKKQWIEKQRKDLDFQNKMAQKRKAD
jgi:hypothetical protein